MPGLYQGQTLPNYTDWLYRQCIVGAGDFIPCERSRCKADYISLLIARCQRWIPWYSGGWSHWRWAGCSMRRRREWVCVLTHDPHEEAQQQSGDWSSQSENPDWVNVCKCENNSLFSNPYHRSPHWHSKLSHSPLACAGACEPLINMNPHMKRDLGIHLGHSGI